MNGEESEAKKIVASIKDQASSAGGYEKDPRADSPILRGKKTSNERMSAAADEESDITQYSSDGSEEGTEVQEIHPKATKATEEPDPPRRRSTRPKRGGKKPG